MKRISLLLFLVVAISISYTACTRGEKKPREYTDAEKQLLEIGKKASMASFQALSSELKQAMSRGGIEEALSYCKMNANPITDSLSKEFGFEISRTAIKLRNPENRGDKIDELIMSTMENRIAAGMPEEPVLINTNNDKDIRVYYPIMIKPMCKSCHGIVSKEITEENYQTILNYYPEDQAVNFFDGSLRGVWKLVFPREQLEKLEG